jgi:hypothetical protein
MFFLGDINFIVFVLGIVCGSLTLAGIMNGFQAGIVLLTIGLIVFFLD